MLEKQFMPLSDPIEGGSLVDFEYMDDAVCIFEVGGDEAAVSFLTGGVPHLETVVLAVAAEIFDIEIDANGVLGVIKSTL